MSRCFPYPYNGGVVVRGAIRQTPTGDPIKLQKERLRIHDTEKRSQNVRKKDKDETSRKCVDVVWKKTIRFVNKGSESQKLCSGDFPDGKKESDCFMRISKLKEDSCESVVSEEHGQPISPTSLCSLSQTGKDEQSKDASQPHFERRGSVFRIRLSSRKQPATETPSTKSPAKVVTPSTKSPVKVVTSSSLDSRATDGHIELASTSALEPVAGPSHSKREVLEPKLGYESLLDQWVPPPLILESDASEDVDWLFGTKQSDERCTKRLKTEVDLSPDPCSASLWPPRATYLPKAEIHALPYTVLF